MHQRLAPAAIAGAIIAATIGYGVGAAAGEPPAFEGRVEAAEAAVAPRPGLLAQASPATPIPSAPPGGALSEAQRAEIEAVIRGYLLANPEIIRDAINELQRRQAAAEEAGKAQAITDNSNLIFTSSRQAVLGNPDGDVTLVEFFDYNCPYCKRALADMKRLLDEDKNLRMVMKEFPILGEPSLGAAQVGIAVNLVAPDKYLAFHEALLSAEGQANRDRALAVAEELGIDRSKIEAAMKTDEVKETISEVYDLANKLGVTGTPSYVTTNEVVVGAVGYDGLKEKINQVRCGQAVC